MARSLNKASLIGNLTRDPELRYTPQGTAVCTFGVATNRQWTTEAGEKREDAEFHRIVAWTKLAELCAQLLSKGRKVYVEGRLQTRNWTTQDGNPRTTTEVVISDMIILDSRRAGPPQSTTSTPVDLDIPAEAIDDIDLQEKKAEPEVKEKKVKKAIKKKSASKKATKSKTTKKKVKKEDDIPF